MGGEMIGRDKMSRENTGREGKNNFSEVHTDVYNWAIYYLRSGLSIIPIKYRDKKPLVSWKEYQKRRPNDIEVKAWFKGKDNVNIAIICGKVSRNLMVIDFDSDEIFNKVLVELDDDLREAFTNTWVVKTGRGYHVYFRYPVKKNSDDIAFTHKSVKFGNLGVDIQRDGRYVLAPPSLHPSGVPYQFVKRPDKIYELSENQLKKLFDILRRLAGEKKKENEVKEESEDEIESESIMHNKELTEDQMREIINVVLPYWKEGSRHDLALLLSGLLYWNGYKQESAEKLIKRLIEITGDEEAEDRLRCVKDTYEKGKKGQHVAYKELIQTKFVKDGQKTIEEDELEDIVSKLLRIVKGKALITKDYIACKESDSTLIICDYKNCTMKKVWYYNYNGKVIKRWCLIATCVPVRFEIVQKPDGEEYRIYFKAKDKHVFVLDGTIKEIVNTLKESIRVTKRHIFEDALSLILNKMEDLNLCKKVNEDRVKGIILTTDGLEAYEIDTDYTIEELKEALDLLDQFVKLSDFNKERVKKISQVIKWFVVSAFGYVFKQHGSYIPHLYLFGESNTGKTATAHFLQNIWCDTESYSLDCISSPFRLGNLLSRGTLPIVINEMNFNVLRDEIIELWKNSVENIRVRSRYGKVIKGYGVFCFTSNSCLPTSQAIMKRLLVIHFDPFDINVLLKQKDKFEKLYSQRHKLRAIGKFAYHFMKKNLHLFEYDWESVAIEILTNAYKEIGREPPKWIYFQHDESSDVTGSKTELIKSVLKEAIFKHVKIDGTKPDVSEVIDIACAKLGWLYKKYENVVLTTAVVQFLNKQGVQVANLKDLSYYLPFGEYKKVRVNGRSIWGIVINGHKFIEWLGYNGIKETQDETEDLILSVAELVNELTYRAEVRKKIEELHKRGVLDSKKYELLMKIFGSDGHSDVASGGKDDRDDLDSGGSMIEQDEKVRSVGVNERTSSDEHGKSVTDMDEIDKEIIETAEYVMEAIPNPLYHPTEFARQLEMKYGNNLSLIRERIEKLIACGKLQSHFAKAIEIINEKLQSESVSRHLIGNGFTVLTNRFKRDSGDDW